LPEREVSTCSTAIVTRVVKVLEDAVGCGDTYGRHCGCDGLALVAMSVVYGSLVFVC
jgi:hypothetical protein